MDRIAGLDSVCESLHLPLQSGSTQMLKAMNRKYTREYYLERVARLRDLVPDMEIAGDFIVGFPGETDEEFDQTVDLVRQVEYLNCFIFKYSPRPGTAAASLDDDVRWGVKKARNQRLLAEEEAVMERRAADMVDRAVEVLVEGVSKRDPRNVSGRTPGNRIVAFPGDESLSGQLVNVHIADATALTLLGHITR